MEQIFEVYEQWNTALATAFFAPSSSQKLLYLDADEAIWEELGKQVAPKSSNPRRHFVSSVKQTLVLNSSDVFRRHLEELNVWKSTKKGLPPFVGLLVLFVLAAEQMVADEQYSATNYHGRLCDLLKIISDAEKKRFQIQFRKRTPIFWTSFNEWLNGNNGLHGWPTAYPFGVHKYISVPISQALVREADRGKLPEFFKLYGLQPGQVVPTDDMQTLVDRWIKESNIGQTLKRIWAKSGDGRSRIAEIVCQELASWEDNDAESDSKQRQLLLVCECTLTPRLSVDFHLVTKTGEGFVYGTYKSAKDDVEDVSKVFGQETVQFDYDQSLPFAVLESDYPINLDVALTKSYKFISQDSQFLVTRQWKPLMVLVHEDDSRLFVEKKRVELGKRHIILVREYLAPIVREHLSVIAADKLTETNHSIDPNIPFGFTAFIDLRVTGVRSTDNADLQCLEPIELTTINLEGGFSLPIRNAWLCKHPPSINVFTLREGKHQAKVEELSYSGSARDYSFEDTLKIKLEGLELKEGTHRISIFDSKGASLLTKTMHFREAGVSINSDERLIGRDVSLDSLLWVMSGEEVSQDMSKTIVGASIPRLPSRPQVYQFRGSIPAQIAKGVFEPDRSKPTTSAGDTQLNEQAQHTHHWDLPSQKGKGLVLGKCRYCGVEQWHGKGTKKKKKPNRKGSVVKISDRPTISKSVNIDLSNLQSTYTADDIFEAMVVLRQGSFAQARTLLKAAGLADLDPERSLDQQTDDLLRNLSALGHIETINDKNTGRINRWEVALPKVIMVDDEKAFIAGTRTQKLVQELKELVHQLGGALEETSQDLAPARIAMRGLNRASMTQLVAELSLPDRQKIHMIIQQPSELLLSVLPPVENLITVMDSHSWPSQDLECFDLQTIRWLPTDFPDRPGCYSFHKYKRQYFVINEASFRSQKGFWCDYRLAKHLGGIMHKKILMAFDRERSSVFVPLGCELPSLYERVLCLESGLAPRKQIKQGYVEYCFVREHIARGIYSRLCAVANMENLSA